MGFARISRIRERFVMSEKVKAERKTFRVGGYLKEIVTVFDATGKVVHQIVQPLMVELKARDIMQIIIGGSILAVPVAFTEETWNLGEKLPVSNVVILSLTGAVFIACFVYFNFYRYHLRTHVFECIKRVIAIYLLSHIVVGVILTIIQKCPWGVDNLLAFKRIAIVAFPASMSAAISDTIK